MTNGFYYYISLLFPVIKDEMVEYVQAHVSKSTRDRQKHSTNTYARNMRIYLWKIVPVYLEIDERLAVYRYVVYH
ncbi:hypothetical protein OsJ_21986 [Oryza sativa Japonica Group]|uniref:Uncharacterized protein n=1 Tax=Oryza sativa subsp. japonica TaxID=39947 RepID=B9FU62_ORYSJ|nr:hypothetical protein OsJ_21986 [Oryza sativa Japonica Group]